ncbi:hypothetical protein AB0C06_28000 [Micromonospora inaquosa]|nr:hypothetical protein [Micromonospora inaquosa]
MKRLDPADGVAHVAENFSATRMANGFEAAYRRFLAGAGAS